ncbi:UBP-type zinc finger domain-containing protein [Streptomyces sp. NPDC096311]|uniref:UBP-type zinc finger domain-containing protein n=1 Tax=Streptomyces sp. NPDC096311 TaxID=3366083 RepID=UPI00380E0E35
MTATCDHLPAGDPPTARTPDGCEECLATGGYWLHLRLCLTCGHVGCCDSSPGKHATAHFSGTSHPVIQSYESGEDWRWCCIDEQMV